MKVKNTLRLFQNFSFARVFSKTNRVLEKAPLLVFLLLPLTAWAQTGRSGNINPANIPVSAAPYWELALNNTVLGLPHLQAQSIVLAIDSGRVISYSINGRLVWNFNSRGKVNVNTPRSPEGTAYINNENGLLLAVNRIGNELWRVELEKQASFPAISGWDGRLFVFIDDAVYCLTASGLTLWVLNLESPIAMAPVLDHAGGISAVLENQNFVRISHFGKIESLRLDRQPSIIVPILEAGNVPGIAQKGNSVLLFNQTGEIESIKFDFNAPPGSVLSKVRLANLPAPPAGAVAYNDQAAVTLRDGRVFLISGVSGQPVWNGNTHESAPERGRGNLNPGDVIMAFDERGIFSLSRNGAAAFTAEGKRRWLFRIPEASILPVLSDEGIIYAAGKDNILRSFRIDTNVRDLPHAVYYGPEPEGSYGLGNPPPSPWALYPPRFEEYFVKDMFDEINEAAQSGEIGENEAAYSAYLMEAIVYSLTQPNPSPLRTQIHTPERIELIRLLGRIGSRDTIPFLVNIFYRDTEPSIRAACCEAIGKIGVDPRGEAIGAFSFFLSRENANRDPQLTMSAMDSIAALCRFSGPPLSGAGILLLTQIARSDIRSDVRNRAQAHLNDLRREGADRDI